MCTGIGILWRHAIDTPADLLAFCEEGPPIAVTGGSLDVLLVLA